MNIILIALSLMVLTLGQFEEIWHGVSLHDLLLGLFLLLNIANLRKAFTDKTKRFGWYFIIFALFSFLVNLSGKPTDSIILAAGYLIRWTAYYLVFCLLWNKENNYIDSRLRGNDKVSKFTQTRTTKWFNISLLVYSVTVLIIGLSQWLFFPDMRILSALGWDDHYYRLIGNWLDPNFTGLILVLGLLGIFAGLGKFGRLGKLGAGGLFLIGILLTYSRSSYLALLIGLIFLFRWRVGLIVSMAMGLLILGYAFLVPKPAGEGGNLLRRVSIDARIRNYNQGFEIFKQSPVYGVGFNFYKYAQEKVGYVSSSAIIHNNSASGNDNSFIFILATTGIVGLGIFLLFWVNLFITGNQLVKASLSAITIHSFFNNSIFFPAVIIWLWLIISCNLYRFPIKSGMTRSVE